MNLFELVGGAIEAHFGLAGKNWPPMVPTDNPPAGLGFGGVAGVVTWRNSCRELEDKVSALLPAGESVSLVAGTRKKLAGKPLAKLLDALVAAIIKQRNAAAQSAFVGAVAASSGGQ
jgi:hypothetical protein